MNHDYSKQKTVHRISERKDYTEKENKEIKSITPVHREKS